MAYVVAFRGSRAPLATRTASLHMDKRDIILRLRAMAKEKNQNVEQIINWWAQVWEIDEKGKPGMKKMKRKELEQLIEDMQ